MAIEMLWKAQATSTLLFKNPCTNLRSAAVTIGSMQIVSHLQFVASNCRTELEDMDVDPNDISSGVPSSFASSPPSVSSPNFDNVDPHSIHHCRNAHVFPDKLIVRHCDELGLNVTNLLNS